MVNCDELDIEYILSPLVLLVYTLDDIFFKTLLKRVKLQSERGVNSILITILRF